MADRNLAKEEFSDPFVKEEHFDEVSVAVTRDHVYQGIPGDGEECALALCLNSIAKEDYWMDVHENHIEVLKDYGDGHTAVLAWKYPIHHGEVVSFIQSYDKEKLDYEDAPFHLKIHMPKEVLL